MNKYEISALYLNLFLLFPPQKTGTWDFNLYNNIKKMVRRNVRMEVSSSNFSYVIYINLVVT